MAHLLCTTCNGYGKVVTIRETKMYACGFVQEMACCPVCHGTRTVPAGWFSRLRNWFGQLLGVRA